MLTLTDSGCVLKIKSSSFYSSHTNQLRKWSFVMYSLFGHENCPGSVNLYPPLQYFVYRIRNLHVWCVVTFITSRNTGRFVKYHQSVVCCDKICPPLRGDIEYCNTQQKVKQITEFSLDLHDPIIENITDITFSGLSLLCYGSRCEIWFLFLWQFWHLFTTVSKPTHT